MEICIMKTIYLRSMSLGWQRLKKLLHDKVMRLGLMNRIIDDSDFKLVNFDCRLQSDSKSNDESELTIAISISF